ncbi:MAG: PQQ-binding-like beta-propeller repeat protein [Pirellulaceae bacterium]|nr:PQQ-binding-like beta-propeller repeat protein [Pirellulaceae bacterium]
MTRCRSSHLRFGHFVSFVAAGIMLIACLLSAPATTLGASEKSSANTSDWPLPRGDAGSSGATTIVLPDDLSVIWEYKADEAIETTPAVVGNRVFLSDVMGRLYAVDRKTGKEIWKKNYDTGFLAAPAIQDDRMVIGDVEGNLYALNVQDGKEIWKQSTDGEISGAAAFHGENVLVTSQDGKLYCFDAVTGKPAWVYQTDDQIRCSPTLAGNLTFLGGCDGQLHIVDVNTGKAVGKPLPLGGPTGSTPAVAGDDAILPIMDGAVLRFDWKKQTEQWRYEDEERSQEYRSSAAVKGDFAIVTSQYKQVDAISIATGKRLWRYTLRRRADASPVIAGDDVWIASTDGRLIRLALADGQEKWQYEIKGSFLAAPAIAGDQLFIADDEGVLRCFGKVAGK